jgi:hypothetical protein
VDSVSPHPKKLKKKNWCAETWEGPLRVTRRLVPMAGCGWSANLHRWTANILSQSAKCRRFLESAANRKAHRRLANLLSCYFSLHLLKHLHAFLLHSLSNRWISTFLIDRYVTCFRLHRTVALIRISVCCIHYSKPSLIRLQLSGSRIIRIKIWKMKNSAHSWVRTSKDTGI